MNLLIGLLLVVAGATTPPKAAVEKPAPVAVERIPIFLQTDARDVVGAIYVTKLREALELSTAYRPVTSPARAQFVVGVLTMDPNEGEAGSGAGQSTVASVTLRREDAAALNQFVYSWVLVARPKNVDSLATELLTAIDKEIQGLDGPTIEFLDAAPTATK